MVSIDFNHNPASSTVDLKGIKVLEGKLVRVASWYDNEWGFSNRMCDTAALMAKLKPAWSRAIRRGMHRRHNLRSMSHFARSTAST